jgi:hypothetical protein
LAVDEEPTAEVLELSLGSMQASDEVVFLLSFSRQLMQTMLGE